MDSLMDHGLAGINWSGRSIQWLVETQVWGLWIPAGFRWLIREVGGGVMEADRVISRGLDSVLRRAVEVPAKTLQLVQSGDVQWYLFFGIGSGVAILIHFLKF